MRVPPLFVVDEFLKISLGLPVSVEELPVFNNITNDHVDVTDPDANYYDANFYNAFVFSFVKFLMCCLGKYLLCISVYFWRLNLRHSTKQAFHFSREVLCRKSCVLFILVSQYGQISALTKCSSYGKIHSLNAVNLFFLI